MTTMDADSRTCPFCGGEILAKALQCRHCRRWMPEVLGAPAGAAGGVLRYSSAQPAVHLVMLSLLTLGLYEIYWFWRNWRDLRDQLGIEVSPGWRTAALFVPILNVAMVYLQLRLVRDSAVSRGIGVAYSPALLTGSFFALALAGNLSLIWLVALLNVLALVPVQQTLNRLWEQEQPGFPLRESFAGYEVAAMLAGGIATAAALVAL